MGNNIIINPDKAGHQRVTQNIINKWYNYLRSIDTEWVEYKDEDGNPYALVPCWHIVFKDGSDWRLELGQDTKDIVR